MKKSELPEPLGLTPVITGAKLRECKTFRGMKRYIILLIPMRILGAIILPEWLIVREREEFACRIMTFTDCQPLVNGQLSTGCWKVTNRRKLNLFNSSYFFCNCQTLSKPPTKLFYMVNHLSVLNCGMTSSKFTNFFNIPVPSC